MNSLLKRQIRKYLSPELAKSKDLEFFLDIIAKSYENFDDQSAMIQRAMTISSEELFEANKKLKRETVILKEVINKLKKVTNTLKAQEAGEKSTPVNPELDADKLVDFIDNQIKEIIEMNMQRDTLLSNLELKNQELSDYAHMISHDLKSPLRTINTLTSWFKEDYQSKIDEDGNTTLKLITNNVEKMDELISGILNYSIISEAQTESYDVDLNVLLEEIISILFIPRHITVDIKNHLPIVKGDKFRLQQLFQNLIDNAVKYSDKPKSLIEIGIDDYDEFWRFYVKDNGQGIEKTYHDKIFQTFQKLDSDENSTGIGLSIAKKIVSFYGGTIWIESVPNEGSTFYFTIEKHEDWKSLT